MTITTLLKRTGQWLRGEEALAATAGTAADDRPRSAPPHRLDPVQDVRYCLTLAADGPAPASDRELAAAWESLETAMAFVPPGETSLVVPTIAGSDVRGAETPPHTRRVRVRAVYLDRGAVTNRDFARFVAAGGYRQSEYWPSQILPQVLRFVDRQGRAGPRFWSDGRPPADKLDHPVVGVSWYEANAYARWVGKRLPTPAEWQQAGCWSDVEGPERRYPWGNAFAPERANTWLGGRGDTVPVNEYYAGCTPNGIYQLIGNVWEWVAALFECQCIPDGSQVFFEQPMGEIRGGAFDTYFETQASCLFRSGQPLLFRGANVGFRCCIGADELQTPPRHFLTESVCRHHETSR